MCGIGLTLFRDSEGRDCDDSSSSRSSSPPSCSCSLSSEIEGRIHDVLANRGPDLTHRRRSFPHNPNLTLLASVLHMRGEEMTVQPLALEVEDEDGDGSGGDEFVLCWNGEVYSYDFSRSSLFGIQSPWQLPIPPVYDAAEEGVSTTGTGTGSGSGSSPRRSDTRDVMTIMSTTIKSTYESDPGRYLERLSEAMSHVRGEYSFILYHRRRSGGTSSSSSPNGGGWDEERVFFGRDPMGRRSLLVSPAPPPPDDGDGDGDGDPSPSQPSSVVISSASFETDGLCRCGRCQPPMMPMVEVEAGRLYQLDLSSSSKSKGVCTWSWSSVALPPRPVTPPPAACAIPRINVVHDASYYASTTLAIEAESDDVPESMVRASETLHALLDRAVRRRVINAPESSSSTSSPSSLASSVAVLFSGGIDSVVLAALAHRHVPPDRPIDLLNVAFTSPTIPISSSPDRAAAMLSLEEITGRWPERRWRFVAVDVPYDEEVVTNEDRIARLMSPCRSAMDFNIASAFWFLGRGVGRELILRRLPRGEKRTAETEEGGSGPNHGQQSVDDDLSNHHLRPKDGGGRRSERGAGCEPLLRFASIDGGEGRPDANGGIPASSAPTSTGYDYSTRHYKSTARILLVGIGADEQLGGYGRHRSVYQNGGLDALRVELKMDGERLWVRNLGRDDRVLSDHGKEARFPYLDEDVVDYVRSLDVADLCDLDRPRGVGDKMILRLIAKRIGVGRCSGLVKRAVQFGSRIAKCSDVDRFGSSRRASGRSEHRPRSGGGGTRNVDGQ